MIYIPGYYGQVGIIAKQARELGMNQPLLGGDGWDSPDLWKLGGDALKNAYISNHYSAENPAPEIQNFVKNYTAKFGAAPDSLAALAYDAAKVLADAIKRAGGAGDSAKLKDAINATKDFAGVTGSITLDAKPQRRQTGSRFGTQSFGKQIYLQGNDLSRRNDTADRNKYGDKFQFDD